MPQPFHCRGDTSGQGDSGFRTQPVLPAEVVCLSLALKLSGGFGNSLGNLPQRTRLSLGFPVPGEGLSGPFTESSGDTLKPRSKRFKGGFRPHRGAFTSWHLMSHPASLPLTPVLVTSSGSGQLSTFPSPCSHGMIFQITAGGHFLGLPLDFLPPGSPSESAASLYYTFVVRSVVCNTLSLYP